MKTTRIKENFRCKVHSLPSSMQCVVDYFEILKNLTKDDFNMLPNICSFSCKRRDVKGLQKIFRCSWEVCLPKLVVSFVRRENTNKQIDNPRSPVMYAFLVRINASLEQIKYLDYSQFENVCFLTVGEIIIP